MGANSCLSQALIQGLYMHRHTQSPHEVGTATILINRLGNGGKEIVHHVLKVAI